MFTRNAVRGVVMFSTLGILTCLSPTPVVGAENARDHLMEMSLDDLVNLEITSVAKKRPIRISMPAWNRDPTSC